MLDLDEEVASFEVLVVEQVFGGVQHADRQARSLALKVHLLGIVDQEEAFDDFLDQVEVVLTELDVVIFGVGEHGRHALLVHPGDQAAPSLGLCQDQGEIDVAAVGALEQGWLGRRGLGVAAGLPMHVDPGVEPEGIGQLDIDRAGLVHGDVEQIALAGLLPLQQGQHDADLREAGDSVIGLIAAGADRRDRVVVIATADQRAADRQTDQVRRLVVRPRTGQAERGHRGRDQPRIGLGQGLQVQAGRLQRLGLQGGDEDIGAGQQLVQRRHAVRRPDIGDHALLVGIVEPEVQAGLRADHALGVGADGAGGRALRPFQLDHPGAHFGQ